MSKVGIPHLQIVFRGDRHAVADPLRTKLEQAADNAPLVFVEWLQKTMQSGLNDRPVGNHPSDIQRRRIYEEFLAAKPEEVAVGDKTIPPTVGIKCLNLGSRGQVDLARCDRSGHVVHRYKSDPIVRELLVGYPGNGSDMDRSKPVIVVVDQAYRARVGLKKSPLNVATDNPLQGRMLGSREPLKAFLGRWQQAFDEWCASQGIAKVFRITSGCVIEKTDGQKLFWRNFNKEAGLLRLESFQNIHRIIRSPLSR